MQMEYDQEKIDEVTLALMWLNAFSNRGAPRAWKSHSWEITDRLFEKGWISDPKGKAKSVLLTEEGEEKAKEFLEKHFRKT
jgi:hypothetical protein